jgi:hypothetical protein
MINKKKNEKSVFVHSRELDLSDPIVKARHEKIKKELKKVLDKMSPEELKKMRIKYP